MLPHLLTTITALLLIPLLSYLSAPTLTTAILSDLRLPRILHYIILSFLGTAILHQHTPDIPLLPTLLSQFSFAICLTYAALYAIISNNLADLEADRLTNPHRPHVLGTIDPATYHRAGLIAQALALTFAALLSWPMFIATAAISLGYYLYSCPPFRLKRIPILAKTIIGLNSLIVTVTGYVLSGGKLTEFPLPWALFVLIPLSLSANFVDLKDTAGDRATGIRTLPVILGQRPATYLIALFTLLTYLCAGLLLDIPILWPLVMANAILHIFFLLRQPYREGPVFLAYLMGLIGLVVLLGLKPQLFPSA